jgi:hypothetical protein
MGQMKHEGKEGKCKFYPRIGHEGPEGGRGIALLFFNLAAGYGWVINATLRPLYPRQRPGTHCIGGWMDPSAGKDGCGKSGPHRNSNGMKGRHKE